MLVPTSAVPAVLWQGSRGIDYQSISCVTCVTSSRNFTRQYHCENPSMWEIIHIHANSRGRFLDQPCYLQTLNSASDRCSNFEAALFQALFTAGVYRYLHCPALASAGQRWAAIVATRICASLGSRMKFKTLCYPVFGRNKNTALPSF